MAKAAPRCLLVLSHISTSPLSIKYVVLHSHQLSNFPSVITRCCRLACLTWASRRLRYFSHSTWPVPGIPRSGCCPGRNVATNQGSLVDGIKHAEGVEELFSLLAANKARLSESHIATAFSVLVTHRHGAGDQEMFSQTVTSRREFTTLSDLAENRILTFEDAHLVNLLYCSFKLLQTPDHSLVRELRNEALRRRNRLETPQLSKMAVCLSDLGEKRAPSMGLVVNAYSRILDETKHFRELSTFMKESNALLSRKFKSRILGLLRVLLSSEDLTVDKASCGDYRKVFMCINKFTDDYHSILDKCASLMLDDVDAMSTREICIVLSCIWNLGYHNPPFVDHLKDLLHRRLTTIDDPVNMAMTMELFGFGAPAHVKFQLEENAMRLVKDMPAGSFGNLCAGLRRMGYLSHTPLHDKIRDGLWLRSSDLTLDILVPVVEYHKNLVWMTQDMWEPFISRVHKLTMEQIAPVSFLRGVYILSLIPTFFPSEELLGMVLRMLPQFHTSLTNTLLKAIKRMARRMAEEDISPLCKEVLLAIQTKALKSLHQNTSPNYLLGLLESILAEGGDLELVDAIFTQLEKVTKNRFSMRHAIECARSLYKTRYFSEELLDRIIDVTLPNINKVTPIQVLALLSPYCSLNYQPEHSEPFFDVCTQRVIPFIDRLPGGFLVDMAHLMSYNQLFPEEVLRHIFSLEFLTKLEEDIEELPDLSDMYRRKLMYLNRTVALECPELQVPWFHEEYCQDMLKKRQLFYHPDIREVQKNLVEVLGGAQYLRSFVTTPYYYDITFECILDVSGAPLTCANYGSALDRGSGLSSSVLSDLMQWDTRSTQLPKGAQRVAIDYMFSSAYCVNSGHMLGMSTMKKRHLELLGYQYIQIPFFEWKSLGFTGREEKEEYLRMKIFTTSPDLNLMDIASAPPSFQDYSDGSIFAPFIGRKKTKTVNRNEDLATGVLHTTDTVT